MSLSKKQIAQIKLDERKFRTVFKDESFNLLEMINLKYIEIVDEKKETNELVYGLTEKGLKLYD
jgi:hypothetical protein